MTALYLHNMTIYNHPPLISKIANNSTLRGGKSLAQNLVKKLFKQGTWQHNNSPATRHLLSPTPSAGGRSARSKNAALAQND